MGDPRFAFRTVFEEGRKGANTPHAPTPPPPPLPAPMRVPNTVDAGAAIDPPAGSINFDDLLLDVDPVLIKDNCQEFAHCFEERLDPGVFARLAAVCQAFRKVVQCGGSKLHLTVNDWEAHGKQGTKDALNKYKKIK